MTPEERRYQKEIDNVARMEPEKIVTMVLKSVIDGVNQSGYCRFKFRLEID